MALAVGLGGLSAHAAGITPGGTIIGVFNPSTIVTSGYVINDPALGDSSFVNNGSTAVYTISNSVDPTLAGGAPPLQATGSSLTWGTDTGTGFLPFSELTFFGGQVPANIHQPFLAGRIAYLNGTSTLPSLIFGADISFYDNAVAPADYLGTDHIFIDTTSNITGTLAGDADFINICGNGSNICTSPLEAYENTEGGTGVTADLTASIVGDPQLAFSTIALTPGQDPSTSGFIGNSPPLSDVPEPASLTLLGAGFIGLSLMRRYSGRDSVQAT